MYIISIIKTIAIGKMRTYPKIKNKGTYMDMKTGRVCYIDGITDKFVTVVSWVPSKKGGLRPSSEWVDWSYVMENLVEYSTTSKVLFGKKE